jgi:hypothetical protein
MPSFSLFPLRKTAYADDIFRSEDSSTRHSPTSSISRNTDSAIGSDSASTNSSCEYLPPIRTPSPFDLEEEKTMPVVSEVPIIREPARNRPLSRMTLQKPLPEVPTSFFDRLQVPSSFHPTRRAPLPPSQQSWIDLSEEDEEDEIPAGYFQNPRVAPPAPLHSKIEREIMRMLQFNEEKDIERRITQQRKERNRKSHLNFSGFGIMKGLRRSMSVLTFVGGLK